MRNILVLMSTYNGEKYLKEQIDSILAQKNVEVTIRVRDDGSTDGTIRILEEYQKCGKLNWYSSTNMGPAKSFLDLVYNAPLKYDYYAFCDQDDYWKEDKLYKAIERLEHFDDKPALYHCELEIVDENSHAAIVTPEEFEQAQMVIMLQHGKHQAGNYTKRQYPLKGKVYCGYCQKLMKYRVLKKLGPSFNCRFSATAVDSPCKRIPISEELLEEIVRNALTVQIKQAEHVLEILHERERKALICFSALERQEEKLSAEKAEIVKQRIALYEQYADGNISKEEFVRQRDAYRAQEDERMEQIQRLRAEKNQIFLPVRKDADNLQTVVSAAEEAGDVMRLSQNVVETFIDRIEVFNDERVKIRFTFEDVLAGYAE